MEELIPLLMVVLILALLFGLVTFVAQVQPAKVLVVAAAHNCARAGVETLAEGRGLEQALAAAVETGGASWEDGRGIEATGLAVRAYTQEEWGRGQVLVCEAGYNVRVDHLPLVSWFYPAASGGQQPHGYVPLRSRVALSIEPYKSRWP